MKLSEILGWPEKEKNEFYGDDGIRNEGFNTALTSCDREIDREALYKALLGFFDYRTKDESIDDFISTMPTWLKRI